MKDKIKKAAEQISFTIKKVKKPYMYLSMGLIFSLLITVVFSNACKNLNQNLKISALDENSEVSSFDSSEIELESVVVPKSLQSWSADNNINYMDMIGRTIWAEKSLPINLETNKRTTVFWGKANPNFTNSPNDCKTAVWGNLVPRSLNGEISYYPACPRYKNVFGPSYEKNWKSPNNTVEHFIRTESNVNGVNKYILNYGDQGQGGGGANKFNSPTYVDFSPTRVMPWTTINRTLKIISNQRVLRFGSSYGYSATKIQFQQVMNVAFQNSNCNVYPVPSGCSSKEIQFNFKTFISGRPEYNPENCLNKCAYVYFDPVQGGIPAVISLIGDASAYKKQIRINGRNIDFALSKGAGTKDNAFEKTKFHLEISWSDFKNLLCEIQKVPSGNGPVPVEASPHVPGTVCDGKKVFGPKWDQPKSWVLVQAGYGQEVYNEFENAVTFLEGSFANLFIGGL